MISFFRRFSLIVWRRLLQLDRPVPQRTEAQIEAEVERNFAWNFTVNLLEGTFFWIGLSFISATTILPLFISKLSHSPLLISLVAVISQAGWYLPQIFVAGYTESLSRKKPVVVNLGFFLERIPTWLWPLAALAAVSHPQFAIILLLAGYAGHTVGAGIVGPAWQDLIAACFPVNRRGRFWGSTTFVGTAAGTAGAIAASWLLKGNPFPRNFLYLFTIGALGISISWFFISLTREPIQALESESVRSQNRQKWAAKFGDILKTDTNYRKFLTARLLMALGTLGSGFITVSAVRHWNIPDATVGLYTVALLVGQTGGNITAGWLADRFGHKLSLELSAGAAFLAFVTVWFAPAPAWYFAAFLFWGFANGATIVSGVLMTLEFAPTGRRPSYVGITNTSLGLAYVLGPILGGALAGIGYTWVFLLSAVVSLVAWGMLHWTVQDPRWISREG